MVTVGDNFLLDAKLGNTQIIAIYSGDNLVWPDLVLSVNPTSLLFSENGETIHINVTISNQPNTPYTINGLPSWLHVSNKTQTGFDLTCDENPTEDERSLDLTVQLTGYASNAILSVTQSGNWLSQFIFDVFTTTNNERPDRIVNLGAVLEGEGQFDWGDGSPVEILSIPQTGFRTLWDLHAQQNQNVEYGTDFSHAFLTAGNHTVTIKTRQGVNYFKFSMVDIIQDNTHGDSIYDYGAEYIYNPYIRAIRKIKSDSLASLSKLFAGCSRASFALEFIQTGLETPNATDVNFLFENFGVSGYDGSGNYGLNDNMRFPDTIYQNFTKKNQITSGNRVYYQSVFEKISQNMLSFSADDTLVSVFEIFKQMRNVGANWYQKYYWDSTNNVSSLNTWEDFINSEGFVDTTVFQKQRNIQDFTGAFSGINDLYTSNDGVVPFGGGSGRLYGGRWLLKQDLFKGNNANNIVLDYTFALTTRAMIQNNFFGSMSSSGVPFNKRIKSMNGCFWNFSTQSSGRISYNALQSDFWGNDLSESSNSLFPDINGYPVMESMIGAFGADAGLRILGAFTGFQTLLDTNGSGFPEFWRLPFTAANPNAINQDGSSNFILKGSLGNITPHNISIVSFLSKFPNVTEHSALNTGSPDIVIQDGAAYNFADFTPTDWSDSTPRPDNGLMLAEKKASDYDTYNVRPIVKQQGSFQNL